MKLHPITLALTLMASLSLTAPASGRTFVHPGISYTQADLDRMKAQIDAKQEPIYSTYI